MKRFLLAIASAVGLLCLGGTPAWAGPVTTPVSWTYNFTPSQTFVSADAPGSGTLSFTNEPTSKPLSSTSTDVDVSNLKVSSTAVDPTHDTFNTNGAWKVGLTLTDLTAKDSTTVYFTGKFGGYFSSQEANVTNQFTGQTSYTWTASNGDQFVVKLYANGFTPPGPPSANNYGSISAHVDVTPFVKGSGGTPEPSTLVLSCLGLGFAGLASWRKRRRSLAAMLA